MDTALEGAVRLVRYIVQKVQQALQISDELKQLMQHVQALQPLLQDMLPHGSARSGIAAPVAELLLQSLTKAQIYVDKVTPMSRVARFVHSGGITEELDGMRQGLRDALLALQAVAVQISSGTSAHVLHLLSRLDSWQVAQQQGVAEVAQMMTHQRQMLSQHRRSARDRNGRLESMMGAIIEHLGTGVPQLVQEINSTLQQPGLTEDLDQVGR
jgi:hypothetical protein